MFITHGLRWRVVESGGRPSLLSKRSNSCWSRATSSGRNLSATKRRSRALGLVNDAHAAPPSFSTMR
jgi:hypothetical protein